VLRRRSAVARVVRRRRGLLLLLRRWRLVRRRRLVLWPVMTVRVIRRRRVCLRRRRLLPIGRTRGIPGRGGRRARVVRRRRQVLSRRRGVLAVGRVRRSLPVRVQRLWRAVVPVRRGVLRRRVRRPSRILRRVDRPARIQRRVDRRARRLVVGVGRRDAGPDEPKLPLGANNTLKHLVEPHLYRACTRECNDRASREREQQEQCGKSESSRPRSRAKSQSKPSEEQAEKKRRSKTNVTLAPIPATKHEKQPRARREGQAGKSPDTRAFTFRLACACPIQQCRATHQTWDTLHGVPCPSRRAS
jgi:hypothetical protein